jgi:mono/diheme cytochrome c family protein
MKSTNSAPALAAAALLGMAGWAALAGSTAPPERPAFPETAIAHGALLAAIGGCEGCHTSEGGAPFAGGRAIGTPFGAAWATNNTPDPATGIGRWSPASFAAAMRRGVRPDGQNLYPAFPYDHFTHASDTDVADLYAYLMTRRPVVARAPGNHLAPPFGSRAAIGIWKARYLRAGPFVADGAHDAEWNRGAYLVESLGHCGACHTPHDAQGAEERGRSLDGGWAEGWYAPPLDGSTPAPMSWTQEDLYAYLRTGLDDRHAAAAGPMGSVAHELARASPADLRAIAVYLAQWMAPAAGSPPPPPDHASAAARAHPVGAVLFAGACATCHEAGAGMMMEGRPPLQLGTPLDEDNPRDVIAIIRQGLKPPVGPAGPSMPAFAGALTDAQLAELVAYLRARYSDRPSWRDLPRAVAEARKGPSG